MDGSLVEAIAKLKEENFKIERDGQLFTRAGVTPVIFEPRVTPLIIYSLRGLRGYITNAIDKESLTMFLHVQDEKTVKYCTEIFGRKREREVCAEALMDPEFEPFPFGMFLSADDFRIKLASLFVETEERNELMVTVAKLAINDTIESADDGISQRITITKGMSGGRKEDTQTKPIIKLKPFRTFREVEQPESEFLIRFHPVEGKIPMIALFEADGGAWREKAIENIIAYFSDMNIPVIG